VARRSAPPLARLGRRAERCLEEDLEALVVGLKGDHVPKARAALKEYLRNLNDPKQPDDERFQILLEAPFRAPPKPRQQRR